MSTPRNRIPRYRLHRPSRLAVVTLDGKDHYLGRHGTAESQQEYHRLIAEWLASLKHDAVPQGVSSDLRINELILAFWRHAEQHYRHPDGSPTGELANIEDAVRPLRQLYGHTLVRQFDSLALEALQDHLVPRPDWSDTFQSGNQPRAVFESNWFGSE